MEDDQYICVGICQMDPDSGYCMGCGRPPLPSPGIVAEVAIPTAVGQEPPHGSDPDNPA